VAVISRNDVIRTGLAQLLDSDGDRVTVVHASATQRFVGGADVVVYDLAGSMPAGQPDDLRRMLGVDVPVVAVQPYSRSDVGEDARISGVAELVGLDVTAADLLSAVQRAAAGTSATLQTRQTSYREELQSESGLTEREMDILEHIAGGVTNDEIAQTLFLSINSVKSYIRAAYAKIGATSRSQAVLWAIEHGLAHPDRAGEPSRS
jgi:DNA-binding NarL/FixJ family response regulator